MQSTSEIAFAGECSCMSSQEARSEIGKGTYLAIALRSVLEGQIITILCVPVIIPVLNIHRTVLDRSQHLHGCSLRHSEFPIGVLIQELLFLELPLRSSTPMICHCMILPLMLILSIYDLPSVYLHRSTRSLLCGICQHLLNSSEGYHFSTVMTA